MSDQDAIRHAHDRRLGCRRHSSSGVRRQRGVLRYSDAEWAAIGQAAALAGMRPGPWAQRAAYHAAVQQPSQQIGLEQRVEALLAELRQHRRVLANIGGNLNDLARAANTTGVLANPLATQTVLRLVRHVVGAADELLVRVRSELLPR